MDDAAIAAGLPTAAADDAAIAADGFDPVFFRALVQNGFESPDRLEPARLLPGPLRIYLKTHDDTGRAIDPITLEATERVLLESARIWSGERFGVAEIARGTATREKMKGWLTVKWSSAAPAGECGRSTVGVDGGYIEFYDRGACNCGMASRVYPRLVRHELGHAMGYYHTDQVSDVMYGRAIPADGCDLQPSERERRYAKYAYGTY
jgi:hypothetical protein